jgi:hypothetical protein
MRKDNELTAPSGTEPHRGEEQPGLTAFEQYRRLLFSIAYRMLGGVADSGDMLHGAV